MQLTISGHHVDVTQSLKNYLSEKLHKLDRHSEEVDGAHVILSVEKLRQKAEATVKVGRTQLYAETTRDNMYASIDLLVDKLDRQLLRHKERSHTFDRQDKKKLLG